jgi:hypothetical protein
MRTIHKYPLQRMFGEQRVSAPVGARFISTAIQRGQIVVWAIVETDNPFRGYVALVTGTGFEVPRGWVTSEFVGTVESAESGLVFHVFVAGEEETK